MAILNELAAIVLYVKDMQSQVEFYRDKLELKIEYPKGKSDYSKDYWVAFSTGGTSLSLHAGGKGRIGEDAPKLVFRVKDVNKVRTELIERGVKMGEVRSAGPKRQVCDGTDPEGNRISIGT
jgi:catechol 2,3-dioxygenase-like lactoylglutathione lyase family enzyme